MTATPEAFAHTPYDGSRKPFSIGLSPLDLGDWIEPDAAFADDLALKAKLFAEKPGDVFGAEAGTEATQAEVLELLSAHLPARFPELYQATADGVRVVGAPAAGASAGEPHLMRAARLVQEDLALMRRTDEGWRLVAAALCFPSSWSIHEKFGRTLDGIHENVPGYAGSMAQRMARIFDSLKVEMPVWRLNWSIYPDRERHHPETKQLPRNWFRADGSIDPARIFVRVERQTLRRLPVSGDILFTIKILADPLAAFREHPEGKRLAAGLRDQILALDADQLAYKALTAHRDAIVRLLDELAG
ncbi:heme-dependent oxidative N-demethylase family protein [Oryzibacter oryziterrae]|uniref:heme-dependent oxidative N-demethylase family protein n=1 Tax=Oryzibacter oryziterrae TaxID=2766474 RepID=UPI001F2CAE8D|nr:DUF3445 domain-containing protein [Oryzibacter oryziterrae]